MVACHSELHWQIVSVIGWQVDPVLPHGCGQFCDLSLMVHQFVPGVGHQNYVLSLEHQSSWIDAVFEKDLAVPAMCGLGIDKTLD